MAGDVWTALVKDLLDFSQGRAIDLIQDNFQDTKTFVQTLGDSVKDQTTKDALQTGRRSRAPTTAATCAGSRDAHP